MPVAGPFAVSPTGFGAVLSAPPRCSAILSSAFMNPEETFRVRAARCLAFGSAVAILFSIAASQILLGLALAALMLSGEKLRMPRIWLPLSLFILGTLVALAF